MYKNLVEPNHPNCEKIDAAINTCMAKAREIYGKHAIDKVGEIVVEYYDKGKTTAFAIVGKNNAGKIMGVIQCSMFSTVRNIEEMVNEIVPHEVAHIICMFNHWDDGHGAKWREVCVALGGNGEVVNQLHAVDGRLKKVYEALDPEGRTLWLTGKQMREAASTGIIVRDSSGRELTLTKDNITGKMCKV